LIACFQERLVECRAAKVRRAPRVTDAARSIDGDFLGSRCNRSMAFHMLLELFVGVCRKTDRCFRNAIQESLDRVSHGVRPIKYVCQHERVAGPAPHSVRAG